MEKDIIIATKRELSTKSGKQYIGITDTDGERYSVFKPELFPILQEGAKVQLIGEQNGDFFNVKDVKLIEKRPSREGSIEKQVLAKLVSELWLGGKLNDDDPEVKGLRRWIREMLPIGLVEEAKQLGAKEIRPK